MYGNNWRKIADYVGGNRTHKSVRDFVYVYARGRSQKIKLPVIDNLIAQFCAKGEFESFNTAFEQEFNNAEQAIQDKVIIDVELNEYEKGIPKPVPIPLDPWEKAELLAKEEQIK